MTDVWLIHSQAALRQSLAQTLGPFWPEGRIIPMAPAELTEDLPSRTLFVWLEPTSHLPTPEAQTLVLAPMGTPLRLADFVWQLQNAAQNLRWPKEIWMGLARLDTATRLWQLDGMTAELTEKEVTLLVYLSQASKPATRADLLRDVWRYAPDAETHTIETHIHRLRQKIEADPDQPRFLLTTKEGYLLGQ